MHKFIGAGLDLLLPAALRAEPLTFDAALQRAQNDAPGVRHA